MLKKSMIVFGAITVAILMVSTATAVEQANSEPIKNYVEDEEQADFMNQLEETDASVYIASIEGEYTVEDFIIFLLSDEFFYFMVSQEITDFLSSELFLGIYNDGEVQEFIQSDVFRDFMFSNVACTFLAKYRSKEGQSFLESTSVNSQCISSGNQPANSAVGMNSYMHATVSINTNEETSSSMTTNAVCNINEESMSSTSQNIENTANAGEFGDILLLFAYLLIGIITWPIAIGVFGLGAPAWGALFAWYWLVDFSSGGPIVVIIGTVMIGCVVAMTSIICAIGWPVLWYSILQWWYN